METIPYFTAFQQPRSYPRLKCANWYPTPDPHSVPPWQSAFNILSFIINSQCCTDIYRLLLCKTITIPFREDHSGWSVAHGTEVVPHRRGAHPDDQIEPLSALQRKCTMHLLTTVKKPMRLLVMDLYTLRLLQGDLCRWFTIKNIFKIYICL